MNGFSYRFVYEADICSTNNLPIIDIRLALIKIIFADDDELVFSQNVCITYMGRM